MNSSKSSKDINVPLHNLYSPKRRRVYQPHGDAPSMTKQEFKDDCDINKIMAKYQRTGAINHFAKYSAHYGDFSACDLQEAHNLLNRARQMFDELPSRVRKLVATPEGFLDFVQDPANANLMAEYGLTNKPAGVVAPPAKAAPAASQAASPPFPPPAGGSAGGQAAG